MSEDEIAFYDALEVNDSAVKILGDRILRTIALELTDMINRSATIDWTQRENVRAGIRLNARKILRKYGYPPDKRESNKNRSLTGRAGGFLDKSTPGRGLQSYGEKSQYQNVISVFHLNASSIICSGELCLTISSGVSVSSRLNSPLSLSQNKRRTYNGYVLGHGRSIF